MGSGASKRKVTPSSGRMMATYPLRPTFQYCEKLFLYTDDLNGIDKSTPPPRPPSSNKSDIFDLQKFVDIDRRATMSPDDLLSQPYSKLMEFLMKGLKDTMSKVRIIFRWVTAQPLDNIEIRQEPDTNTPLHQLWRIQQGKGNYAQLVLTMCRLAGIPCVIIHGLIKGSTYTIGQSIKGDDLYGEWNAILIDGSWRFLNAFWGTCAVDSEDIAATSNEKKTKKKKKKAVYSCDENYFLTDPDHFVASHFPFSEQWQMLETPISLSRFEEMAFLKDRFFNLGMGLITHDKCIVRCLNGEVDFRFSIPEENSTNLKFRHIFSRLQSLSVPMVGGTLTKQNQYVFIHRIQPNILSLEVRVPTPGIYRLELVGKDASVEDSGYGYDWVVLYKIVVEKGKGLCKPFPKSLSDGWGPGFEARRLGIKPVSHKTGRVKALSGEVEIRFDIGQLVSQQATFCHKLSSNDHEDEALKDHVVHWLENKELVLLVRTPVKGEYALAISSKDNSDKGAGTEIVCNYLITSEQSGIHGAFPRDFGEGAGQRDGMTEMGVKPISHTSPVIYCHREDLEIVFELERPVELFAAFSGVGLRTADSKRLVSQHTKGNFLYFQLRIPALGSYGLKVVGMDTTASRTFQNIFDYLIEFKKRKPKKKIDKQNGETRDDTTQHIEPHLPIIPEITPRDSQLSIISELNENANLVEVSKPPVSESSNLDTVDAPDETMAPNIFGRDPELVKILQNVKIAAKEQNETDLEKAIHDMRKLYIPDTAEEMAQAQAELNIVRTKREILAACKSGDQAELQKAVDHLKDRQLEVLMRKEMLRAQRLIDRHKNIQKNLHDARELDKETMAEIRSYANPPNHVIHVMKAALLLLGYIWIVYFS